MTPMSVELIWMSCSTVWPGFDVVREIMQGWGGVESPLIFFNFFYIDFSLGSVTPTTPCSARAGTSKQTKNTTHLKKTKQKQNRLKQE